MVTFEKECDENSEPIKDASHDLPKVIADDFNAVEKFCGKITTLFLPYLPENIPEKEWLRFQGKIAVCLTEFIVDYERRKVAGHRAEIERTIKEEFLWV